MDYTYIEQLLERYWEANTTLAEEAILKRFFTQCDLPEHLARYQPLFTAQAELAKAELSHAFDERVMATIHAITPKKSISAPLHTKARRITWAKQLSPLYKAAAVVAITLTLGNAVQYAWQATDTSEATLIDYQYSDYKDTYVDDKSAYEVASKALNSIAVGASMHKPDTMKTSDKRLDSP